MSGGQESERGERTFIERGIAAAHRARSVESRAGSILSLGVVCVLGVGLLAWYYSAALRRPARAAQSARALSASRAQAEMPLPPLPPIGETSVPQPKREDVRLPASPVSTPAVQPRPTADALPPWLALMPPVRVVPAASVARAAVPAGSPRRRALERRLSGPAFTRSSVASGSQVAGDSGGAVVPVGSAGGAEAATTAPLPGALGPQPNAAVGALVRLLEPTTTPAVAAQVLPTRTLLLPKGAFIDCTLETAIDSTLPGMTTCITATDTFGADGRVVLLERGSKLVGETQGEALQGSSRVFVLWTEARTPTGVVIPLASPGTDELGRSGLPGAVNRHFFERFGAALLISIIDTGAEAVAQPRSGTIIYSPGAAQDVMSEVLKDTLRIPPTIVKHQGDRIQVLVARDLDFRSVYELRAADRRP